MEGIVQNTLITFAALPLVLNLHTSPVSTTQTGFPMVVETRQSPTVVVAANDTLGSIAKGQYGDSAFWTVLWNDNPWIENPNVINENWILKLRTDKPSTPELLKENLKQMLIVPRTNIPVYQSQDASANDQTTSYEESVNLSSGSLNDAQIQFLGTCEAGMTPTRNTGNGYYGAFQFSYVTWKSMGTAYERADLAPIEVQIDSVQRLLQRSSIFTQFPACARKMRSIGLI